MKSYDCIFLDRDGTINFDPGYISSINDFNLFDFAIPSLKKMAKSGNKFCIVTNQSGVAKGLIKKKKLNTIHNFIKEEFKKNQIPLLSIYSCFDHPDYPSERRKPGPGMFFEAQKDFNLDLDILENKLKLAKRKKKTSKSNNTSTFWRIAPKLKKIKKVKENI